MLPTGTVTFLFTDIEGSTRLWAEDPDAMKSALAIHDALLGAAIRQRHGIVVKNRGEGDSVFAVFRRARDAVEAAIDVQRSARRQQWPTARPIRVRIAIVTGEAEVRDGDYFGGTVNRCALLREAAHGEQVLVARSTAEVLRDGMAGGTIAGAGDDAAFSLVDLGEHRLREFLRSERIYQLAATDLPERFPPLRNVDPRPAPRGHALPMPATPLVGREREVAEARDLLLREEVRLLTLTGPGGTGKTRLGLQIASDCAERFRHGVFFAPLASIREASLVAPALAEAVGLREAGSADALPDNLKAYLRDRHALLLLDNFEQVLEAAPLVADLLEACPRVEVLVTSRAPLRIRGEQEYPVAPLALAPAELWSGRRRSSALVEALSRYDAITLFAQRASAARPGFALNPENAAAVAEICARLDGLPLAIELAAARVKLLAPEAILARLSAPAAGGGAPSLGLLTGGARDLPERQQTLRAAIGWSYDLLTPEEQDLLRCASVFAGGATAPSVESVATSLGLPGSSQTFDLLTSLVDHSLLRCEPTEGQGEPRFLMLETVREFGLEQAAGAGDEERIRRVHREHFLRLAERASHGLRGPDQSFWLERLEEEHDNLRAALEWSLGECDDGSSALRLADALYWFWMLRGYLTEGRSWLSRALEKSGRESGSVDGSGNDATPRLVATALRGAGLLAWAQGDYEAARTLLERSVERARAAGDDVGAALALAFLGRIALSTAPAAARAAMEESLAIFRRAGDEWGSALSATLLGYAEGMTGDSKRARALLEEGLERWRDLGDQWGLARALNNLAETLRFQGDVGRAARYYGESLTLHKQLGAKWEIAAVLHNLGHVARHQGDHGKAAALFAESMEIYRNLGNPLLVAHCLAGIAGTLADREPERAARLLGAASALLESGETAMDPVDAAEFDRIVESARARLPVPAYAAAWAAGRAMSLDQAAEQALSGSGQAPSPPTNPPGLVVT